MPSWRLYINATVVGSIPIRGMNYFRFLALLKTQRDVDVWPAKCGIQREGKKYMKLLRQ